MKLHVHIDRLILESGQRLDREQLARVIGQEVGARISAEGLPAQLRSPSMKDRSSVASPETANSPVGVGHAIYGSLQQ